MPEKRTGSSGRGDGGELELSLRCVVSVSWLAALLIFLLPSEGAGQTSVRKSVARESLRAGLHYFQGRPGAGDGAEHPGAVAGGVDCARVPIRSRGGASIGCRIHTRGSCTRGPWVGDLPGLGEPASRRLLAEWRDISGTLGVFDGRPVDRPGICSGRLRDHSHPGGDKRRRGVPSAQGSYIGRLVRLRPAQVRGF